MALGGSSKSFLFGTNQELVWRQLRRPWPPSTASMKDTCSRWPQEASKNVGGIVGRPAKTATSASAKATDAGSIPL